MRVRPYTWRFQTKMIFLAAALVLAVLLATALPVLYLVSDSLEREMGNRALDIARTLSVNPALQQGFFNQEPVQTIAPLAEQVRQITEADFIIVMDRAGRRFADSDPTQMGKATAGLDYGPALMEGRSFYTRLREGEVPALAGVAPIHGPEGELVGLVSVGFRLASVELLVRSVTRRVGWAALGALLIGVAGAVLLARHTKAQMFGLEPLQIASILEERNTILQSVREGIIAVDADGRITVANEAARRILGLSESPIGRLMGEAVPQSRLPEVLHSGQARFDDEMIWNDRLVMVNRTPLRHGHQIVGAVASFRDLTELKQLLGELNDARRYSEAMRAQAHEFRNRLHAIAGLIQLEAPEEALDLILRTQVQHQELLDLLIQKVPDPLVEAIILGKYNRAAELHVRLELDPASRFETAPKELGVDMLVTLLGNLLDNAMEAVASLPEAERWVRLYLDDTGPAIRIDVADSGPGVPAELRECVFCDGYSTKGGNRRGFGLALVNLLVTQAGGSIAITNNPSQFSLSIPRRAAS